MSLDPQTANAGIRSEINITPLVDVCLMLLIIFMVVTPLLQTGVAVDLPQTSKAPALPGEESQLTVSIQGDGSVHVRDVRVELPNLPEYLAGIHAAQPGVDVVVRGDRRLQYDRVCEVLAIISQAGFQRVGLVTEQREVPAGE